MSKIIYIAVPYSDKSKAVVEQRYEDTAKYAAKLVSEGNVAFSAIVYGHTLLRYERMPNDWEFWQNFCESFLVKSDELHVYMLDGWDDSTGVKAEIELAEQCGIPVTYVEVKGDKIKFETGNPIIDKYLDKGVDPKYYTGIITTGKEPKPLTKAEWQNGCQGIVYMDNKTGNIVFKDK